MGDVGLFRALCDQPDLVHDIMDHLTTLWLSLYERVVAEVRVDHIHIWEDMAGRGGPLISPDMIERFMMPCYDGIIAFAKRHDVRLVSVDSDGNVQQLVPIVVRPFEVQAGNDILAYHREYPELGIIGGIDKRVLSQSPKAVGREARQSLVFQPGIHQ
jgi:hypothetical protein